MKKRIVITMLAAFLVLHPFQNVYASQSKVTSSVLATVEDENTAFESTIILNGNTSTDMNEQQTQEVVFTGWESILQYMEEHPDISELSIQLGNDTVVPKLIWDAIGEHSVKLTLILDNGFYWVVCGENINLEETKDIDVGIETNGSYVSNELIESIPGDASYIQIHLNHKGDFGFTAECTFMIREEFSGYTSKLYYYNVDEEQLDLSGTNQVLEDGTTCFSFTHASDFIIYLYQQETDAEENQIVNAVKTYKEQISLTFIIATCVLLGTGLLKKTAIGVYILKRKAGGKCAKVKDKKD